MRQFCWFFLSSVFAIFAQAQPQQKLDLNPTEGRTPVTTTLPRSSTGDIDMNQFKNIQPAQKGPKVKMNASCVTPDGYLWKAGEAGFKDCMEKRANRILNQPHPPEAVPYEPRTN